MLFNTAKRLVILNEAGEPVLLTKEEKRRAEYFERQIKNSLGYEVPITTLTTISASVTEQKFFEVAPADYVPIVIGNGAWSSNITTYRSYAMGDAFETGVINMSSQNGRLASTDAGVDALNILVFNWAKEINWTIFELQQAAKSGNWDLIIAKTKARKKNWDLGIQRIAFLGANGNNGVGGSCVGLLNQGPGITTDTTTITQPISTMTPQELKTFCAVIIEKYRANCQRTAFPDIFTVPESDYNGMASQSSPEFPMISVLQLLEDMFKTITRNKNFKILPCAYADASYHAGIDGINGKQVYVLHRMDQESIRMDIPLDFNATLQNSVNNFQFQNVGMGQFTGVLAYRPEEMLYFTYNA